MQAWNVCDRVMMRFPWSSSLLITTGKTAAADLFVQKIVEKKKEIDWRRNAVFGGFGLVYLGCFQYYMYNFIYWRMFPGLSIKMTAAKVIFDQLVLHPVCYFPVFYYFQQGINTREWGFTAFKRAMEVYGENFTADLPRLWAFWFPAQSVTFGLMPMHLRLPWVAFISFFFTACLSWWRGDFKSTKEN